MRYGKDSDTATTELLDMLIKKGAEMNTPNKDGIHLLTLSAYMEKKETIQVLVNNSVKIPSANECPGKKSVIMVSALLGKLFKTFKTIQYFKLPNICL